MRTALPRSQFSDHFGIRLVSSSKVQRRMERDETRIYDRATVQTRTEELRAWSISMNGFLHDAFWASGLPSVSSVLTSSDRDSALSVRTPAIRKRTAA